MDAISAELIKVIVPAVGTVASLLVTWGLFELRKFIKTKTDSEAAVQAFDVLADLVQTTVVSINQEASKVVDGNGKLDPDYAKALKHKATSIVLSQLPATTRKVLDKNLKVLEVYVENRIEQCVAYEKRAPRYG